MNTFQKHTSQDKKIKTIDAGRLQVKGHLLKFGDVVIQISNISMITIEDAPLPPFPIYAAIMIVAGFLLMMLGFEVDRYSYSYDESISTPVIVGFLLLCVAGVVIYYWYRAREDIKGNKYLNISLNSGNLYYILFRNEGFLREVLNAFSNIFEDATNLQATYIFDQSTRKITIKDSIIGGKENVVNHRTESR